MSERVRHTHPDVAKVLDALEVIARYGRQLADHAVDLHSLAYERTVSGDNAGSGSSHESPNLAEHGDQKARVVWHHLENGVRKCAVEITALESALRTILGGESPGRLRGTTIKREEFDQAVQARQRRNARADDPATAAIAEYSPVRARGQIQPPYPRTPTVSKKKREP